MNNKRKAGIIVLLFMFILYCNLEVFSSHAAGVSASVSVSSSSVNVGETVTATISVSGSDISAYTLYVSYNASVLQYSSGSGSAAVNGGGGSITLSGTSSGSTTITFKAIANGTSSISAGGGEAYNLNLESLSISGGSASVTVSAPTEATTQAPTTQAPTTQASTTQAATEATTQTTTEATTQTTTETTTEATTTEEPSDNCFLSSLEISSGDLSPAFDKNTLSYTVSITDEIDSIEVNAEPEDDNAQVSIDEIKDLKPGSTQTISITVTAENGDTKIYKIEIDCVDTNVYIIIDGSEYHFAKDYNGLNIPEGFKKATSTYNDAEIIVYTTPNGLIECVYLLDNTEKGAWYVYYQESGTVIPLVYTSPAYIQYIILPPDETLEIPEGYTAFTYQLNGSEVTAYRQTEDDTIILLYALNTDSTANWYYYDTVERTLLRYTEPVEEEMIETTEETESPLMQFYHDNEFLIMIIAAALAGVMLITIIILICVLVHTKKKYKQAVVNADDTTLIAEESISEEADPETNVEAAATEEPLLEDTTSAATEEVATIERNAMDEVTTEALAFAESVSNKAEASQAEKPQEIQIAPIINTIHMPPSKKSESSDPEE